MAVGLINGVVALKATKTNLGSVHNTPEKFANAALFRRLGLPSTPFRHALQTGGI